jgi:hypothetical protein
MKTGPVTRGIGGWLSPTAGLDAIKKKEITPAENQTPTVQSVASVRTELFRLLVRQEKTNLIPIRSRIFLFFLSLCFRRDVGYLLPDKIGSSVIHNIKHKVRKGLHGNVNSEIFQHRSLMKPEEEFMECSGTSIIQAHVNLKPQ